MRKAVKNCRSLNMQTIKLKRDRPASISVALALAITMLIVYLLTLQSCPKQEAAAAAAMRGTSEIRMDGMDIQLLLGSIHDDETQANVAAALCAQSGGAGFVLREGEQFAVVQEAGDDFAAADAPVISRGSRGLTMKIDAPADTTAAVNDALSVLRALAGETKSLADSMEAKNTDARTVSALLNIYRTQLESALSRLANAENAALVLLKTALENSLDRVNQAIDEPNPGKIRMVHAAGCMEWISLSEGLMMLA